MPIFCVNFFSYLFPLDAPPAGEGVGVITQVEDSVEAK